MPMLKSKLIHVYDDLNLGVGLNGDTRRVKQAHNALWRGLGAPAEVFDVGALFTSP